MKKLAIFLLIIALGFLIRPGEVFAGCQMQQPTLQAFKDCVAATSGSTTFSWLYYPGSSFGISKEIVAYNNTLPADKKANLDVRLYIGHNVVNKTQVDSFIADLGSLNSTVRINARLNNETNNLTNEELVGKLSPNQVGSSLFNTYSDASQTIKALGLDGKVTLGIALDHWAPDKPGFVSVFTTVDQMRAEAAKNGTSLESWLKQNNIMWMINGYVSVDRPTTINNRSIEQLLKDLHLPTGISYAFFESGTIRPDHNFYDPRELSIIIPQLYAEMKRLTGLGYNFQWLNVLTKNPDNNKEDSFNLLDHPELLKLFNDAGLKNITPEDAAILVELIKKLGLILCPNGAGFAESLEACDHKYPIVTNPGETCSINGVVPGGTVFRPRPCDHCDRTLPPGFMSQGRASTTEVFATFKIPFSEYENAPSCGGYKIIERSWEGMFQIGTNDLTVPFVGFGSADKFAKDEALVRYLADYYDGTLFYDGKVAGADADKPDPKDTMSCDKNNSRLCQDTFHDSGARCANVSGFGDVCVGKLGVPLKLTESCKSGGDCSVGQNIMDVFNRAGVLRKTLPPEIQDGLRRKFVQRVQFQKGNIPPGDYKLKIGDETGFIHNYYFNLDATGKPDNNRVRPMRKDYPQTGQGSNDYQNDLDSWRKLENGLWARLWYAIPMTSREDSPGSFDLSIQSPPGVIEKDNGGGSSFKASFPHLARLYEVTRFIKKFFSFGEKVASSDEGDFANPDVIAKKQEDASKKSNLLASVPQNILPSKGEVLGDTSSCGAYFQSQLAPQITRVSGNTYKACWTITGTSQQEGQDGCDWSYKMAVNAGGRTYASNLAFKNGINNCFTWGKGKPRTFTCDDPGAITFNANPGDSVSLGFAELNGGNFAIRDANDKLADCKPTLLKTKVCKIDANGNPGTECFDQTTPPTQLPACGNAFFYTPTDFANRSIEDTINSKNDLDIVCTNPSPITARVTVENDAILVPEGMTPEVEDGDETTLPDGTIIVGPQKRYITIRTSRKIGIGVQIPYLEQIWDQVKYITKYHAPLELIRDLDEAHLDASSKVTYRFSKVSDQRLPREKTKGFQDVGISPGEGTVYYPELGGIQCNKVYQIKTLLPPEKFTDTTLDVFYKANCTSVFRQNY